MKNKIKFFGCCCLALLLLGSGKISGQTIYRFWDGGLCHNMSDTYTTNCSVVQLDGTAHMDFYRWTTGYNPSTFFNTWYSGSATNCTGYTTEHESRLDWDPVTGTWTVLTRSRTRSCVSIGGGNYGWDNGWSGNFSNWTSGGTITGTPPHTASTTYVEIDQDNITGVYSDGHTPHDHTSHPYDSLTLTLPSIVYSINFISPDWIHYFHDYSYSWTNGNVAITENVTSSTNYLPIGVIRAASTASSLRFTGSAPQIQKDASSQLTTTYLYLPNNIWFDNTWNGSYNGVQYRPWWDPVRDGIQSNQTLGFWHGYSGPAITVTNGTLLLGDNGGTCTDNQNFNITSSSGVLVDAYNIGAPDDNCAATLPTNVWYNPLGNSTTPASRQPIIDASVLNYTNSNFACNSFTFCGTEFTPTFSALSATGSLLIDPNVLNFNAGARIINNATGAPTIINSKHITVASDNALGYNFYYAGTTAPLTIFLSYQVPNCNTPQCAFFDVVNGNFTTVNNGTSLVLITDDENVVGSNFQHGSFHVGGDFMHTNTSTGSATHEINVNSFIDVEGTTVLTGEDDQVRFISRGSWINFGTDYDNPFTYTGYFNNTPGNLLINAGGNCTAGTCADAGGFVHFAGQVSTLNEDAGTVSIISDNHYVKMDSSFIHSGINGDLYISGHTGVDILAADMTSNLGVSITRTGTGRDSIVSEAGHVDVRKPLSFVQSGSGGSTGNGLNIWANGACDALGCGEFVGGYVWLRNDVDITNINTGKARIEATKHFVRIGTSNMATDVNRGNLTHTGVDGDLVISAGSSDDRCTNVCDSAEFILDDDNLNFNYDQPFYRNLKRNFVWINGDVNITMAGTANAEGNAIIRSWHDIVQFDNSVTFNDTEGANLWVDGYMGVRTLGPTHLFNNGFSGNTSQSAYVTDYAADSHKTTPKQGYVTYLSKGGFIDFGKDHTVGTNAPGVIGENTPFYYEAAEGENALLIEGHSRVFFGDSTTIKMAPMNANSSNTPGNAKIYTPDGWIKFADTTKYEGYDGNLIIYANGEHDQGVQEYRSCLLEGPTCDARGGFVLFDSMTYINYNGIGQTWIRSKFDDVVIGDNFTYTSIHGVDSGEVVIQAGQDIYGRNYQDHQAFYDSIIINQPGEKSILFEAKKTIHFEQNLFFNRNGAAAGDITLKAGYPTFSDNSHDITNGTSVHTFNASFVDSIPSAELTALTWGEKGTCPAPNYVDRFGCMNGRGVSSNALDGGDIWFEGHVLFDLTTPDNVIKTTLRAYNSLFIDSTLFYQQYAGAGGDVLLFAETGNIEAAVTRQNDATASPRENKMDYNTYNGFIANSSVVFDIQNDDFNKEIRIQAGNQVWGEPTGTSANENAAPTNFAGFNNPGSCWITPFCKSGAELNGNILFNKPFIMNNAGSGNTLLSAARDIETQVMAPFNFSYNNSNGQAGALKLTAGRHIETHAKMQFDYPVSQNTADLTLEAGRLSPYSLTGSTQMCKATEEGTNLTESSGLYAFDPDVETGGVRNSKNNDFALGGKGNGSILLFDSLEVNYFGGGTTLLVAENGNIESDPYLHRHKNSTIDLRPTNPGQGGTVTGNLGDGYMPFVGLPYAIEPKDIQHDAQLTFNHDGSGKTQLKAIDIKLHDKLAYYTNSTLLTNNRNGQLYVTAYDSILTRNIEYVNATDTGSVFITTAKYKPNTNNCDGDYCTRTDDCGLDNLPIQQGHIVLGYGADCNMDDDRLNMNDSIMFNFSGNYNTQGANVYIRAGYEGHSLNAKKGTVNRNLFSTTEDRGKGYGGNITFDFMKVNMATGSGTRGGYMEISTPNGNIWGKDSMVYNAFNGDLVIDAGAGSVDDPDAQRWNSACPGGSEQTLNTLAPLACPGEGFEWRTGNIMMKGGSLDFNDGTGNATFRTREGFIDTYDAFTVTNMKGHLLKYAGSSNNAIAARNQWGDVSERDFYYEPSQNSGSVFYGADDNIMFNYGYSNNYESAYNGRGNYDIAGLTDSYNPFYSTSYKDNIDACRSIFDVNTNGYLWYHGKTWERPQHILYRGCIVGGVCSPFTGFCSTSDNKARDLVVDFRPSITGGFASVANNFIDVFTKFEFFGGTGSGLHSVPGMYTLRGEPVQGYGLYMKSQFDGTPPEKRRATCEGCKEKSHFPMGDVYVNELETYEWTYIGFHDDARIHTNDQKSLIEAPVIEFFGHAELDAFTDKGPKTKITLKADSLIFHDSVIFNGANIELLPFTTGVPRDMDMRYGVINDRGDEVKYYRAYGLAIEMNDRNMPVLELGYQRCVEPLKTEHEAPNWRSINRLEPTPKVGGDIVVTFKNEFTLPIFNSVVANHARISFNTLLMGNEYANACIRTDLLRIRNKVEFYTDPVQQHLKTGKFVMVSNEQLPHYTDAGIYPHHLHLEPGSELSIPGEDSLSVYSTSTIGGYGKIHENINVKANGILAPGYASLMEHDCQTGFPQGKLSIHNLYMEKDAVLRISIGTHGQNCQRNPVTNLPEFCTQADTLYVQDSLFFFGKIPLYILPETDYLEPGCYLFMIYNDLNVSSEYVLNLELKTTRIGDYFFSLDYSERGRVYLCISDIESPIIQRYVHIHAVDGVTTDPKPNIDHFVQGHQDFTFNATYANNTPLEVFAIGYYSRVPVKLPASYLYEGVYEYQIRQVVQPWDVYFGDIDTDAGGVGNVGILDQRVWSFRNTLFVNVNKEDIVSVYNMTGILCQKLEIPAGLKKMTLERGVYVVTLKDGSVHKIIIN